MAWKHSEKTIVLTIVSGRIGTDWSQRMCFVYLLASLLELSFQEILDFDCKPKAGYAIQAVPFIEVCIQSCWCLWLSDLNKLGPPHGLIACTAGTMSLYANSTCNKVKQGGFRDAPGETRAGAERLQVYSYLRDRTRAIRAPELSDSTPSRRIGCCSGHGTSCLSRCDTTSLSERWPR